jgi:hypothetical protein
MGSMCRQRGYLIVVVRSWLVLSLIDEAIAEMLDSGAQKIV